MDDQFTPVRPAPPPLRIHHLMACAAVAAVQFSLFRASYPVDLQQFSIGQATIVTIGQSFAAIGLTLAIFSIYWHFRGYASLSQPGQWLLIGYLIVTIGYAITIFLALTLPPPTSAPMSGAGARMSVQSAYFIVSSISAFLSAALFLWCAWRIADTPAWRFAFVVLAISRISPATWFLSVIISRLGLQSTQAMMTVHLFQATIVLLCVLLAVMQDVVRQLPRYWTHWVGVGLSVLAQSTSVLSSIYFWLTMK